MNGDISHYTVYPVAPPTASFRTIVPEPGSPREHSEATRTSVVFTTEKAPLDGRLENMSPNKKRHHSITSINKEPQNLGREQKQCDSQLQLEEFPTTEKRRCQPPRATKAAAESNIRQNAPPSNHMSRLGSEYSSDDSDGEFNPNKVTHTTVWERRRMIGNRVAPAHDNHTSTASSINDPEDRRRASARFLRLGLGSQEPSREPTSNLLMQQMDAAVEQFTNHDRSGPSPMALEADQINITAMDIDQQPDPEAYLSDDSSESSTVDSMNEARPLSPTTTVPPETATVKLERSSAVPETSFPGHALITSPEDPFSDATTDVGQRDDNTDVAATANTVEDFTPQAIRRSIPVVLNSHPRSPEILSITEEMAAARASRPSLPERPPPQVHAGPSLRQTSAGRQTGATDISTHKIREIQSGPISHLSLQTSSAQLGVCSLSDSNTVGRTPLVHPQVLEGLVHQRRADTLRARHVSHETALPSTTGPCQSEEAPQEAPPFLYSKFRLMTTTSDADLSEFIHLIRAHAGCADVNFLDCVKRYLTKKHVLRKLEQRPDYLDLILDQATAPSTAIALHQALVHALKTLDAERITVRQLASRVHNLENEFSIKYSRPVGTGENAQASQIKPMLGAQLVANNRTVMTQNGSIPASKAAVLGDNTPRNEPPATPDSDKCPHRVSTCDQNAAQGSTVCDLEAASRFSKPTATSNTAHGISLSNRVAAMPNHRSIAALTSTGDGKYTLMMRSRLLEMREGDIYPRCDRCRRQDLGCVSFRTEDQRPRLRCLRCCRDSHNNCTWFDVTSEEIKWLNDGRQDKPEGGPKVKASVDFFHDATSSREGPDNADKNTHTTSAAPAPLPAIMNEEHRDSSTPARRPKLLHIDKDYTAEMKKRASKLKRFEEIPVGCDRCTKYNWSCIAYTGKCFDCHRSDEICKWTNLKEEDVRSLVATTTYDEDEDVEVLKEVIVLD